MDSRKYLEIASHGILPLISADYVKAEILTEQIVHPRKKLLMCLKNGGGF
jgi:hypothetical protein